MSTRQPKALIFGALPPPVGGVSSIVSMLHELMQGRSDLLFAEPLPKGTGLPSDVIRSLRNMVRLAQSALNVARSGRVLFFCSAGVSFYEKLAWILILLLLRRRPVMVMVDGRFPTFWQRMPAPLKSLSTWAVNRKSVTLAAQSPLWKGTYRTLFPAADVIEISATVSPDFTRLSNLRTPQPGLTLYVGWIIPEKGIVDLLDAFVAVKDQDAEARLRLVGPMFSAESDWECLIAQRGLSEVVKVVGPINDRSLLISELQRASIFVLPSHFEGFPVALIEAITLGIPSIATAVGGIPDILDGGNAGIIVPPRDPAALANAIKTLLDAPHHCTALSKSGATRAKTVYSKAAFVDSYLRAIGLK